MQSAGLLLYRRRASGLEVFLVHPGGPYWQGRDRGAWSIPKGGFEPGESPLEAARREFAEETGFPAGAAGGGVPDDGPGDIGPGDIFEPLGSVTYSRGKVVHAWAVEGDCDPAALRSVACTIEWPPRSGRSLSVPEVDRGAWFPISRARERILPAQRPFLDRLEALASRLQGPA